MAPKHRSFKLTKPLGRSERAKVVSHAFGSYTPEKYKKELKEINESVAKGAKFYTDAQGQQHRITEAQKTFARKERGDGSIRSETEMKDYSKGLLTTGREADMKLKSGLNMGSVTEKSAAFAREELRTFRPPEKPRPQDPGPSLLDGVRDRLHIQPARTTLFGNHQRPGEQAVAHETPDHPTWRSKPDASPAVSPDASRPSTPSLGPSTVVTGGGSVNQHQPDESFVPYTGVPQVKHEHMPDEAPGSAPTTTAETPADIDRNLPF